MASLKEVRNRIQSVSSTQQITKAMKMVAAAKLRRAQDNIIRMRPYAQRLNTILANLTRNADDDIVSDFGVAREVRTDMRVMLAARPVADSYRIDVDNVLFTGKGGIVPDNAKPPEAAIRGRSLSLPVYPQGLAAANVRGTVLLAIRVSPEGRAEEVAVTQSMLVDVRGRPQLMKQALRAFEWASTKIPRGSARVRARSASGARLPSASGTSVASSSPA